MLCDQCGLTFSSQIILESHINIVHGNLSLPPLESLQLHVQSIKEYYKRWQCDQCDRSYTQSGNLSRHKRNAHKPGNSPTKKLMQNRSDHEEVSHEGQGCSREDLHSLMLEESMSHDQGQQQTQCLEQFIPSEFICIMCGLSLASLKLFQMHLSLVHDPEKL